ncbi:RNA polymerase sigma-70 factor, ECF subfamily [Streptomyces zhaozhouensis]|uniref:RNA polymerase sigma-70 factor, ECF subfamily n=1 Tax=Streptomyces zhaozhouensis TaxID=1300267 RepID=A0A286DSH5_9ACTN|nr:sigma-70 family RNA polymerase sigma factor [Streptomyces zhaozhouensis]SOD61608.1 RNA polymerase sigma-70 factor, ECF subfamily [Streptomyces zhaozhouensis]
MNDETPDMYPHARAVHEITSRLPAAFHAFHERYLLTYREYAELQLQDEQLARRLVDQVMRDLASSWTRLMSEPAPEAAAWAILKISIAEELERRGMEPALTTVAAFRRTNRHTLEAARPQFAALESSLGLFTAISHLPERQFDVMVLQFVLGYTPQQIADIMGVELATVRSHRMMARTRLARELRPRNILRDERED